MLSSNVQSDATHETLTTMRDFWGYTSFNPGQHRPIDMILQGKVDILGILPTGAGKTMLFILPTVVRRRRGDMVVTIVVSPLTALMHDQVASINARVSLDHTGRAVVKTHSDTIKQNSACCESRYDECFFDLKTTCNTRGTSESCPTSNIYTHTPAACYLGSTQMDPTVQFGAERGDFAFIYLTPEKLAGWTDSLKRLTGRVMCIVVDEAHCISSHGNNFREDYRHLSILRATCPGVPIVALTATATHDIEIDIRASLRLRSGSGTHVERASINRPNLRFDVKQKSGRQPDIKFIIKTANAALRCSGTGTVIVYVITRRETESIARALTCHGLESRPYHAGMDTELRRSTMQWFMGTQNANVRCIVATICFVWVLIKLMCV